MMLDIKFNNDKVYMHENRERYNRTMRDPHYRLIDALSDTMRKIDPEMETRPAKCLSRIFRDTRFSKDKSPYRDHHWIAFRQRGIPKEQAPMFWFEFKVDAVGWGLGFWGENRDAMAVMRQMMLKTPKLFSDYNQSILRNDFKVEGDSYKRISLPVEVTAETAVWYSRKEILIRKTVDNPQIVLTDALLPALIEDYLALGPVYQMMKKCDAIAKSGGLKK